MELTGHSGQSTNFLRAAWLGGQDPELARWQESWREDMFNFSSLNTLNL